VVCEPALCVTMDAEADRHLLDSSVRPRADAPAVRSGRVATCYSLKAVLSVLSSSDRRAREATRNRMPPTNTEPPPLMTV
jgi:hypothetical protein